MPSPQAHMHIWPNHPVLHGPGDPSGTDCTWNGGTGRCVHYLSGIGKAGKTLPIAEATDLIARGLAVDHPPKES